MMESSVTRPPFLALLGLARVGQPKVLLKLTGLFDFLRTLCIFRASSCYIACVLVSRVIYVGFKYICGSDIHMSDVRFMYICESDI